MRHAIFRFFFVAAARLHRLPGRISSPGHIVTPANYLSDRQQWSKNSLRGGLLDAVESHADTTAGWLRIAVSLNPIRFRALLGQEPDCLISAAPSQCCSTAATAR
jgi:hypothetical protein